MAEYHKTVSLSSPDAGDIMFSIYECISNASNVYFGFGLSSIDSTTPLVFIDTTLNGTADSLGTPTSGTNFPNGSYMVITPATDYPGGGRWQCLIKRDSNKVKHELSYSGGWNMTPVSGSATFTFSGAATLNSEIELIDAAGVQRTYQFKDAVTSGTVDGTDGDGQPRIHVLRGSSATNSASELETAIEHANGHNGSITVTANSSAGVVLLSQTTAGVAGNTTITLDQTSGVDITSSTSVNPPAAFTSGADIGFIGKVTTGLLDAQNGTIGNVTKVYLSTVRETYATNKYYYYFRMLWREGGGNCTAAWYIGGYLPFDPAVDTKPVCALSQRPYGDAATGTLNCWENPLVAGQNVTPADYSHTASVKCYVKSIANLTENGRGDDRGGNYIAPSAYLFDSNDNVLGIFGSKTFRGFDNSVADWSMDSTGTYMVTGAFLQRFKEGYTP